MRASEKAKIRQRRIAHTLLVVFSFSLMFLGKADFSALRHARMGASDFIAPFVDLVSAPVRGVETMAQGIRTVASLRAENVRPFCLETVLESRLRETRANAFGVARM